MPFQRRGLRLLGGQGQWSMRGRSRDGHQRRPPQQKPRLGPGSRGALRRLPSSPADDRHILRIPGLASASPTHEQCANMGTRGGTGRLCHRGPPYQSQPSSKTVLATHNLVFRQVAGHSRAEAPNICG